VYGGADIEATDFKGECSMPPATSIRAMPAVLLRTCVLPPCSCQLCVSPGCQLWLSALCCTCGCHSVPFIVCPLVKASISTCSASIPHNQHLTSITLSRAHRRSIQPAPMPAVLLHVFLPTVCRHLRQLLECLLFKASILSFPTCSLSLATDI